jgi:hypothetical protein
MTLYGARMGRDILFGSRNYARDAYDPSEARDPKGEWTSSGGGGKAAGEAPKGGGGEDKPGVVAHGPKAATEWRDRVTAAAECCKTLDALMESSVTNQGLLGKAGEEIGKMSGAELKNPGAKKRKRLAEKLARPGRTPARITDAARIGFNVTKPEQAEAIVKEFAKRFPIADEGWATTPVGYFDRKLMVKFPNGQMGEVQIWHPDMLEAKEVKGGHKHYQAAQALAADDVAGHKREAEAMMALYHPVLDSLSPEWNAALGRSGSSPNISAKAA